jgi:hypothetical protein
MKKPLNRLKKTLTELMMLLVKIHEGFTYRYMRAVINDSVIVYQSFSFSGMRSVQLKRFLQLISALNQAIDYYMLVMSNRAGQRNSK